MDTHVVMLIDESGSMQPLSGDTIGGFNSFLDKQKELPNVTLTVAAFSMGHRYLARNVGAKLFKKLDRGSYNPNGGTGLYDAMCSVIDDVGDDLRRADFKGKVVFVVITDGEENSSLRYRKSDVLRRVEHQTRLYNWDFVYLGANQDSFQEAGSIGVNHRNIVNYSATSEGTRCAYHAVARSLDTMMASKCEAFSLEKDLVK